MLALSAASGAVSQNWNRGARPLPTEAPATPLLPKPGHQHPVQCGTSGKQLANLSLSPFAWNVFFKLSVASSSVKLSWPIFKLYPGNCLDMLEKLMVHYSSFLFRNKLNISKNRKISLQFYFGMFPEFLPNIPEYY